MIYTFHKPVQVADNAAFEQQFDDVQAIPETVSIWAIIFPGPWLLWHKLWFEFAAYFLLMLLVGGLLTTSLAPLAFALSGLPGFYLWLEGHNLRRNKLERRGYALADVVDADDEETAFTRYFHKALRQQSDDLSRLKDLGLSTQGASL